MYNNIKVTEEEICATLDENGVFYFPDEYDSPIEMDSLTFISIIVSLEEKYGVSISPEYMTEPPNTYKELTDFLIKAVCEGRLEG